jgi:hypothetical protein
VTERLYVLAVPDSPETKELDPDEWPESVADAIEPDEYSKPPDVGNAVRPVGRERTAVVQGQIVV